MDLGAYLTAQQIAILFHVHARTVYRWAAADHWRHTEDHPCRYSWADAQASYDKRHTDRTQHFLVKRLTN